MMRTKEGDLYRREHPSERFPVLAPVLCMDGGAFTQGVKDGRHPVSDYGKAWKLSDNRWLEFGTLGEDESTSGCTLVT